MPAFALPRPARRAYEIVGQTIAGFMSDRALSRGAAIAYYSLFSMAPLLLIVLAIAGIVFGHSASLARLMGQLTGLVGPASAKTVESMIQSAGNRGSGTIATIIGFVTLLVTASGVFSEIQSALNDIWRAKSPPGLGRLVRARLVGLGLVLTLGFLMIVSLVVSALLTALGDFLAAWIPGVSMLMDILDFIISLVVLSLLFAAIYKFLPDQHIAWRDVAIGSVVTALLFTGGKFLIGTYIAGSHLASSYGTAGAVIVVLAWIYYSAQIFLLGAEFTKVCAGGNAASRR